MPKHLEFAVQIALEAGEYTLLGFNGSKLTVEIKKDASPVTEIDRGAESLLRKRIENAFPDDGILGEEYPEKFGSSGVRWILDPIDGTKSFIHGVPLYSTLVGVEKDGIIQCGVIVLPALGETLYAEVGGGAWHLSHKTGVMTKAAVSKTKNLLDALFLTSERKTFGVRERFGIYDELEAKSRLTRTWGDAYGYFLVATGKADFMVDPELNPWDAAPLSVILKEAGGVFTDWQGNPTIYGGDGIGSNGLLHKEIIDILGFSS